MFKRLLQKCFSEDFWRKTCFYLLLAFVFIFPFNVQTLVYKSDLLLGKFSFYNAVFLNLSEVLLWLVFLTYGFSLVFKSDQWNSLDFKAEKKVDKQYFSLANKFILVLMMWVFIAILSIFWARDVWLASGAAFKWLEFLLLFVLVVKGDFINWRQVFVIIIFTLSIQVVIGVLQFLGQHSLGISILGESTLSVETLNIAKIDFFGLKIIRPAGTFSHANIFGAMMLFAFILITKFGIYFKFKSKVFIKLMSVIFFVAAVISFSRVIWCGLFFYILYLNIINRKTVGLFVKKHWLFSLFVLIMGLVLTGALLFFRLMGGGDGSWQERVVYFHQFWDLFLRYPWGVGVGNYLSGLNNLSNLEPWQIQPVHNVFGLMISEIGLLTTPLIVLSIVIFMNIKKNISHIILILVFLLLANFDHYFYSLWSGQILLVLSFSALIISTQKPPISLEKN